MRKIVKYIFVFISLFFIINNDVIAKEKVKVYFFHGDGCPHCKEENEYLNKLNKKNSNFTIVKYEVWNNKDNQVLMEKVKSKMNIETNGVPLTIIGSTYFIGYSESNGMQIERAINYYQNNSSKYEDIVSRIKNNTLKNKEIKDYFSEYDTKSNDNTTIKIPLVGKVNLKNVSIVTAAATIGLIDGFNPCAMWVLLFIISMLLGMKDNKRRWIIGLTFIFTSALIYMLIMSSWITIVVNVGTSIIFRNIIAIISIVGAFINLKSFIKESRENSGCHVVDAKKRKKIFQKIKKITMEKNLLLALIGIVFLSVSVNVVELACSAGLPVVFSQILAINNIQGFKAFVYTLVYILFFLLDDIVVFSIAMITTKIATVSTKYNKYSHLLGGIIMFIIGILLLLRPEWLMFNFK